MKDLQAVYSAACDASPVFSWWTSAVLRAACKNNNSPTCFVLLLRSLSRRSSVECPPAEPYSLAWSAGGQEGTGGKDNGPMRDGGARAREGASEVLGLRAAMRAEFGGANPVRGRAAPRDPPERKYVLPFFSKLAFRVSVPPENSSLSG